MWVLVPSWRSVLAWLDLTDDELLFLEGAEDFDMVGLTDAEVVQAKDVEGNVTLRLEDVLEAIVHAWEHRQRNRGRAVCFPVSQHRRIRRRTRSPVWQGHRWPSAWREARAVDRQGGRERDSRKIADFLIAEGKLPKPVQEFIWGASDETLWAELIAPVESDLKADSTASIIQEVKDRGRSLATTSTSAPTAPSSSLNTSMPTPTRPPRASATESGRAELLRLFHQKTRQSLPASFRQLDQSTGGALLPTPSGATTDPGPGSSDRIVAPAAAAVFLKPAATSDEVRPPTRGVTAHWSWKVAPGWASRQSRQDTWQRRATGVGLGSTDKDGTLPAWVVVLDRVNFSLASEPGIQGLVLDDIAVCSIRGRWKADWPESGPHYRRAAGKLIVTSGVPWPQRLRQARASSKASKVVLQTPAFKRSEIAQYMIKRGCPTEQADTWAGRFHRGSHTGPRPAGACARGDP